MNPEESRAKDGGMRAEGWITKARERYRADEVIVWVLPLDLRGMKRSTISLEAWTGV
jgi:hypothetical protein